MVKLPVRTGAVTDWYFCDAQPRLYRAAELSDSYIVLCEGQLYRITKEDYDAGNRVLIPVP